MISKYAVLIERLFRYPRQTLDRLVVFITLSLVLIFVALQGLPDRWLGNRYDAPVVDLSNVTQTAKYFADNEITAPYKAKFWEVGQRSRQLSQWLSRADKLNSWKHATARKELLLSSELTALHLFPFLQEPPRNPETYTPLADLRNSYVKGSRGIVIPVGGGEQSVRFASHLIVTIRTILGSKLPIEIAYAGEEDLSEESRDTIAALGGVGEIGLGEIDFLDVLSVFDDESLQLRKGGWAIKAFAVLASKFEEVILLDADAVFLQKPDVLFDQRAYIDKGAYLFHDRLLWQHAYRERHDWWKDQIKEPSAEMNRSLVWTQDYAEECDSGVVVVDKSRVEVFVGLLHVAWQNTHDVREEVTYRQGHGDKESWWFGLEVAGSTYKFERHYGSIIGWADKDEGQNVTRVCSFVIAHVDQSEKLIWYNGSLLKNKRLDPEGYEVPDHWMMDGKWSKGRTKEDMSCMAEAEALELTGEERSVLQNSIDAAKTVDKFLKKQGKLHSKES
ncbi:Fc.00g042020.m01.CDS01 [Cosmosporella sp. VM-42]